MEAPALTSPVSEHRTKEGIVFQNNSILEVPHRQSAESGEIAEGLG